MNLTETRFGTYGDLLVQNFLDNAITDLQTLNGMYRQLCRQVHPDYLQTQDAHSITSGLNAARKFIEQQLTKSVELIDEALLPRKARSQLATIRRRCNKELHDEQRRFSKELKRSSSPVDINAEHQKNERLIRHQYVQQARSVLILCSC